MKFYQVQYKIDSGFYFVADDDEVVTDDHPDVLVALYDDVKGLSPKTEFKELSVKEWTPEISDKGEITNIQFGWNEHIYPYSTESLTKAANQPLWKLCKENANNLHGKTIVINGKKYQLNAI